MMQINPTLLTSNEKLLLFRLKYLSEKAKPHDFKNSLLNEFEKSRIHTIKNEVLDWLMYLDYLQESRADRILELCHTGK